MKSSDIDRIQEAGLISPEQRNAIVEHFKLDRETNKLLIILSMIGGILVTAGIILLISSNWEGIPRFVKIGGELALMLGSHYGGWQLRRDGHHPALSEGLHFLGSGFFLANIALVGQIYNLSSRPPNAILFWMVGFGALPWLLRSKAQYILLLCAFGLWLGLEMNQEDSVLYFDGGARQFMFYAILGVTFAGIGMQLERTTFNIFGPATEKFGLLMLHITCYPLSLGFLYDSKEITSGAWILAGVVTLFAMGLLIMSGKNKSLIPDARWRWVWAGALAGMLVLTWVGLMVKTEADWRHDFREAGIHWIAAPVMFCFCLLQAQIGLLRRNPWLVNVAITFIGLHVVTAYFELFGSMQTTGLMFVISGLLLVALAFYLERKRRKLLTQMNASPPTASFA